MNVVLGMLLLIPPPQPIQETDHLEQQACSVVEKDADVAVRTARETKDDLIKDIVIRAAGPFCSGWKVVTVYRRDTKLQMSWVFQKTEGSGYAPHTPRRVSWASSISCPMILELLEELASIKFGVGLSTDIRPSLTYPEILPPPMPDGAWYTIYGNGYHVQPSLRSARISISSNDGEIANWSNRAITLDKKCWQTSLPN